MSDAGALQRSDVLRYVSIALVLVVGGIHLQQYEGPLNAVPTINTLFILNAVGAAAIALVLAAERDEIAILAAFGAIGMIIGSLISLAIARASTIFDYSEPTLRFAVLLAGIVEVASVIALAAFITARIGELGRERAGASTPA